MANILSGLFLAGLMGLALAAAMVLRRIFPSRRAQVPPAQMDMPPSEDMGVAQLLVAASLAAATGGAAPEPANGPDVPATPDDAGGVCAGDGGAAIDGAFGGGEPC